MQPSESGRPSLGEKILASTDLPIRLGMAGWNIPSQYGGQFSFEGSHLERYASRLDCTEINSSFYRPHRLKTYERWASLVPADFRFAVKIPKAISHAPQLNFTQSNVQRFLDEIAGLGVKLGVLLLQLPPTSVFDERCANALVTALLQRATTPLVCEPRHASWFTSEAEAWLTARMIARVAADPARIKGAGDPGGWTGLAYYRLHGSPRIYYSSYDEERLRMIKTRLIDLTARGPVWCIFDNTAAGAAMGNLLALT